MNTHSIGSGARRWWLSAFLLAASSSAALPALAANSNCSVNGYNVNPNKQNVQEFGAAPAYAPTLVTLGVNKTPSQIASDVGIVLTWTQIPTPPAVVITTPVTLNTTNQAAPTFLAPSVSTSTDLTFRLTVTCPGGASTTDTGTATILNVNRPPVAYASATPSIAYEGDTILLHSTAPAGTPVSSDPDGDALFYLWTKTSGPGSAPTNATSATASYVAPATGSPYTVQFQLQVSDRSSGGLVSLANVVVNVTPHLPPTAVLACPQHVAELSHVVLDGSGSAAQNGGTLSYAWTQTVGSPEVIVGGSTGSSAAFDAPSLTTGFDGLMEFELKVTESDSNPAPDLYSLAHCAIQIDDITPPQLSVPADIVVEAASPASEMVTWSVHAQDAAEDLAPYLLPDSACTPQSGSLFSLASAPTKVNTSTVNCEAFDLAHNRGTASFHVSVQDTTAPVISAPGGIAAPATGPLGALVDFDATTSDAVDGPGAAVCVPAGHTTFALGDTLVTCTAADARGNTAVPKSFTVNVFDLTPPIITGAANQTLEATSASGAVATFSLGATDVVDGVVPVDCSPNSGDTFPLGTTTVWCTATDHSHNSVQASFDITVEDTTAPVISGVDLIVKTLEATSPAGAPGYFTLTAVDIVDGDVAVLCTPASGSTFDLGDTTVECTATDAASNTAETSFVITVKDTTPPSISGAEGAGQTLEATSSSGALANFTLTATDIVDGNLPVTCTPASGSTFPLGDTTVQCTATDAANNAAHASFVITVEDTTAPVISGAEAAARTLEAISPAGAPYDFTLTADDIVDGGVVVDCTPASGSTFALGETTVDCSASDARHNASHASFVVTVEDTTAPVIDTHGDEVREATGPGGASVNYGVVGTFDVVDVDLVATCTPASGNTFALGSHTVTCHASDGSGNAALATSFTVTVRDTTRPVIDGHAPVVAEATGPAGASVNYGVVGTFDVVDVDLAATCAPASGMFAIGTTTVICGAADASGNVAVPTSFTVKVEDTTAPHITQLATINAPATSGSQANVTFPQVVATDAVGVESLVCKDTGNRTFTAGQAYPFNAGDTEVACTAHDAAGNSDVMKFLVHVSYSFNGFFQPVDNAAVNTVKAGSAIPVKFSLGGNQGLAIFAVNSPASIATAQCDGSTTDEVEVTVTAGNSSLSYDAGANQYNYVWKTEKNWIGCRQLRMTLKDGSVRTAMFKFR
jgi:hypothetical protein